MKLEDIVLQIKSKLEDIKSDIDLVIEFEYPQDAEKGHISTNFALKNCKKFEMRPVDLANKVSELFNNSDIISKVEVAGPGFINFFINNSFFEKSVLFLQKDDLVSKQTKDKKKYNLEYVSANPTGDLHLGHARIGVYADSVSRVMKKSGYDITREFYINDAGSQMKNLGLSVKHYYLKHIGINIELPEDGYRGDEIKAIAQTLYNDYDDKCKDSELQFFIEYAYEKNLSEIKKVLSSINIDFDVYTSEKTFHDNGSVEHTLEVLKNNGDIYEEDGATWLNSSKYNDDKNRVLIKADGSYTYLTSDIAYHLNKFERNHDKLIDILGGDHHGYIPRLASSIQALGKDPEDLEVRLVQMVNILQNNEKVKMSKRAGTSVTIKDILNLIDAESIRYFLVMRSNDTQLDFDLELTTKRNSENPVYYIQYAHARICSVLKKIKEENITINDEVKSLTSLDEQLVFKLLQFNNVVHESAKRRLPHLVANYLYELATLFHSYYNNEKILNDEFNVLNNKINVIIATKNVINQGLDLLGIVAKEEM